MLDQVDYPSGLRIIIKLSVENDGTYPTLNQNFSKLPKELCLYLFKQKMLRLIR